MALCQAQALSLGSLGDRGKRPSTLEVLHSEWGQGLGRDMWSGALCEGTHMLTHKRRFFLRLGW